MESLIKNNPNTARFLLLLTLFGILYMAGLHKPVVIDYDEGFYAEISREMFTQNEYLVPSLNGENNFEKPPMLYWGQMLGYSLFGINAFGARFVNALAGIALVLLIFLIGQKPLGATTSFRASLILGSSIFFVYLSRIAMTDMLLTLFFTLCLYFAWKAIEQSSQNKSGTFYFWTACAFAGFAMLTKGAIGILFPAITVFIYLVTIGRLRVLFQPSWLIPGIIILITIGFSWYLLLGFNHPEGFSFMKELFIKHHFQRFSKPMEGHSGPIYFYLVVFLAGFMPWSAFTPLAAYHSQYRDSSNERVRFLRFFLLFSLVTFIFFSIAATKLPNYICPALPGIALLTATLFDQKEITGKYGWLTATYSAVLLVLGLGIFCFIAPTLMAHLPQMLGEKALKAPVLALPIHLGYTPYICGTIFIVTAVFLVIAGRKKSPSLLFTALSISALVVTGILFMVGLPVYDSLVNRPLTQVAQQAALRTPEDGRILLLEAGSRPSVNFYSRRKTVDCSIHYPEGLKKLFQEKDIRVGITTEYYLAKLNDTGIKTERLFADRGYVLFRLPADDTQPSSEKK